MYDLHKYILRSLVIRRALIRLLYKFVIIRSSLKQWLGEPFSSKFIWTWFRSKNILLSPKVENAEKCCRYVKMKATWKEKERINWNYEWKKISNSFSFSVYWIITFSTIVYFIKYILSFSNHNLLIYLQNLRKKMYWRNNII